MILSIAPQSMRQTINELLVQLDGFSDQDIIVIAGLSVVVNIFHHTSCMVGGFAIFGNVFCFSPQSLPKIFLDPDLLSVCLL